MRCVLCGPASDMAEVDEEEKCPRCLYEFVCYAAQHDMAQGLTKKKSARGVCTRRVLRGPPSDMAEVDEEEKVPECVCTRCVLCGPPSDMAEVGDEEKCPRCLYETCVTRPAV